MSFRHPRFHPTPPGSVSNAQFVRGSARQFCNDAAASCMDDCARLPAKSRRSCAATPWPGFPAQACR
eukprot:9857620-Lingulodinium_polyedra.AAC.1